MDKVGYARGLVKYSTQNAISQHWTKGQTLRHVLRPRVLIYVAILGTVLTAMVVSLAMRVPFKVDVVRDRGSLARIADGGRIENVFRLQIMNATEAAQQFHISVSGMPDLQVVSENDIAIASTQARWVAVRVQGPMEGAAAGSHTIHFEIVAQGTVGKVVEKAVFIVPR
jgi:polyferredoxin